MRRPGLLLALGVAVTTTGALAAPRSVVIGDIVIRYDDTRFRALARPPRPWPVSGDSARQYLGFACIDRLSCFDEAILAVTAMPAEYPEEPPPPLRDWIDDPRDLWGDGPRFPYLGGTKRDFGGLVLAGSVTHSRCRSAGGMGYEATGILNGTRYVFSAGHPTCGGGIQGLSQEMFEELLTGIAILPDIR